MDIFEPRHEPARCIYLAFQDEATKRKGRTVAEWTAAERDRVYREAVSQAEKLNLRVISVEEVVQAERSARGHVDYGAKWAYRVVEAMRTTTTTITARA